MREMRCESMVPVKRAGEELPLREMRFEGMVVVERGV